MKKTQFYGIWIYAILCLVLVLLYRYYTDMFETTILGYNLSLWSALIINLILLITSVVSLRGPRVLAILGIIFSPLSTYLFYISWTNLNYPYLAGFLAMPIILLLITTIEKMRETEVVREALTTERRFESEELRPAV